MRQTNLMDLYHQIQIMILSSLKMNCSKIIQCEIIQMNHQKRWKIQIQDLNVLKQNSLALCPAPGPDPERIVSSLGDEETSLEGKHVGPFDLRGRVTKLTDGHSIVIACRVIERKEEEEDHWSNNKTRLGCQRGL
jgi:hypothetical protein